MKSGQKRSLSHLADQVIVVIVIVVEHCAENGPLFAERFPHVFVPSLSW
jgi:hypothetical protein